MAHPIRTLSVRLSAQSRQIAPLENLGFNNISQLAQRIEREQARVVAVAEMDRVSIVVLRLHFGDPQRLGFRLTQHGQLRRRRGRRSTFLPVSVCPACPICHWASRRGATVEYSIADAGAFNESPPRLPNQAR